MQSWGVEYDVKMGAGRDIWVWTVHTPNPKRGVVTGSRTMAIRDAEKAIKQWCYQHPHAADAAPLNDTFAVNSRTDVFLAGQN
jgi:hypothetical protein